MKGVWVECGERRGAPLYQQAMLREWGSSIPAVKWLRDDPHDSPSSREEVPEGGGGAPQPSAAVQRAAGRGPPRTAPPQPAAPAAPPARRPRADLAALGPLALEGNTGSSLLTPSSRDSPRPPIRHHRRGDESPAQGKR